jgi:pimeloyl-ACP methyl ester carboxylesterase
LLLAALFVSACQPIQAPTPGTAPAETATYTPRFEPAACRYEIPEGYQVECGNLIVPEDRSNPDGPTIRVYVVNFKTKAANPAPDPVILVPGGPAVPTMAYLWWIMHETTLDEALRGQRDTLLIEHRGSNMSEPAFYCPEMESDVAELANLSLAEESEWSAAAYRACHERLVAEGHNLSLYGPVEVAADVADLRLALGYEEVNIYSQSYSTLPAFYLLRDHPEGIRSVVFDGVWPPEIFQTGEMLKVTQGWLDALFKACADDAACHAAYPDLETIFYETLANLRNEPVAVTVEDESGNQHDVKIDDLKYANYVLTLGLFGGDFVGIPAGIMAVHNHDYASVAQGWLSYLAGRHGETGPGSWTIAFGANYSDTCLQEGVTGNVEQALAAHEKIDSVPSLRDWANLAFIQEWVAPCEYWNVTPASDSRIGEPVASDVPTLMLVSTYDAFMAPYFTDAAIERFGQGHRFELPVSHLAALVPCGAELVTQFLADPSQSPDASCIQEMTANWVLPE